MENTFRDNFRRYPTRDANNKRFSSIPTVIRVYKYRDPNFQHCACLPLRVFKILLRKEDDLTKAIGQLASGSMFLGMRPSKYVTTASSEEIKPNTKILSLSNIWLYKRRGKLHQKDAHLEREAYSLSITFKFQKNRKKSKPSRSSRHNQIYALSRYGPPLIWDYGHTRGHKIKLILIQYMCRVNVKK